jgi:hypothetical protein
VQTHLPNSVQGPPLQFEQTHTALFPNWQAAPMFEQASPALSGEPTENAPPLQTAVVRQLMRGSSPYSHVRMSGMAQAAPDGGGSGGQAFGPHRPGSSGSRQVVPQGHTLWPTQASWPAQSASRQQLLPDGFGLQTLLTHSPPEQSASDLQQPLDGGVQVPGFAAHDAGQTQVVAPSQLSPGAQSSPVQQNWPVGGTRQ